MKGNEQIELKAQRYLYERAHLSGSCVVTTFDPFDVEQAFIDGAEWQKNTSDNKPAINHSVLMKTTQGIAEGEWQGEHWLQYRWSWTLKDSDVLAWMELSDLDEQCEQKHINDTDEEIVNAVKDTSVLDMVEPKFKVGDWVASNICNSSDLLHIIDVDNKNYEVETQQGNTGVPSIVYIDNNFHLWTIQDAKDGDVLVAPPVNGSEQIFIFKEIKDRKYVKNAVEYYCRVFNNEFCVNERGFMGQSDDYFTPATKEQCELLFKKMKEAGYQWDDEKKELKKVEQKLVDKVVLFDKYEGLTDFERALADICIGWIGEELGWKQYIKDNADVLLKIAIKKFNSIQDAPFEQKSAWSEEDEEMTDDVIKGCVSAEKAHHFIHTPKEVADWLKSLKDRIGG